ncbi:MAG TPA: 50S ribosomal protein L6 [Halanaerobiaceae bacterium]|nr:50S ribosomal protein L6 [Bacillota bacterium]HHU92618.1 50S ribosomal protein L6 [Halanaerobiaceae bacterium]HOA40498.1 50S ribosomal protein L6 [Halanaerobiales bacterium]HPZ62659.1 50S ribosomal protein L6 [Halanaerobiales bacterium]HQD03511.1 50S ribosomal protein L6 [Halanaerobiales bacterium]
MSRIGKMPIDIPEKVEIKIDGNKVTVKGPKGELSREFNSLINIEVVDNQIQLTRKNETREAYSMHGLSRSLLQNMVTGVTEGFEKKLEMVGVGYSARLEGKNLVLEVGYSHPVTFEAEDNIEFEVDRNTRISVKGIDKQRVGAIAAQIRAVREPEPYKGKGIKYVDEHIRRKVGKTG